LSNIIKSFRKYLILILTFNINTKLINNYNMNNMHNPTLKEQLSKLNLKENDLVCTLSEIDETAPTHFLVRNSTNPTHKIKYKDGTEEALMLIEIEKEVICYRCGKAGHIKRGCAEILNCPHCGGNHMTKNCKKPDSLCQFCGSEDHLASNCNSKASLARYAVCQLCYKRGHIATECKNIDKAFSTGRRKYDYYY
jgi:hypothetical protein